LKVKVLALPLPTPRYVYGEEDLVDMLARNPKLLGGFTLIGREFGLGKGRVDLIGWKDGNLVLVEAKLLPRGAKLNGETVNRAVRQMEKYVEAALRVAKAFHVDESRVKPILVFGVDRGEATREIPVNPRVERMTVPSTAEEIVRAETELAKVRGEIEEAIQEKAKIIRDLNKKIKSLREEERRRKRVIAGLDLVKVKKKLAEEVELKRVELRAIRQELTQLERKLRYVRRRHYEMVESVHKGETQKLIYRVGTYGKGQTAELVGRIEGDRFIPYNPQRKNWERRSEK